MTDNTNIENDIINCTRAWLEKVVVALNFCPFAGRELERNSIRYRVLQNAHLEECLETLIEEYQFLDQHPETETTLLILPGSFQSFDDFLDLVEIANALTAKQGYQGIYQLANFHPDYQFADSEPDDPANYTNRSPYPMLHLIREASLEQALKHYPEPENIPDTNIKSSRKLGLSAMQQLLKSCCKK